MRDDHRRAPLQQPVQRLSDQKFGLGIHARSGFVENQKFWIVGECASETYELPLANRKSRAALGNRCFHALRLRFEPGTKSHFTQRAFSGGARNSFSAKLDVGFQRAGKKERVLQNDPKNPPQLLQVHRTYVHTVQQNLAALNIIEPQQQLDNGGLARAGVPHDRKRLAGINTERHIAQDPIFLFRRSAARVGKPNVPKLDLPERRGQRTHFRRRHNHERLIEQPEDALGSGHSRLQDVEFFAQVLNWPEKALSVQHEREQYTDRDRSRNRPKPAHPIKQGKARHAQEFHRGIEERKRVNGFFVGFHVRAIQFFELSARFPLAVEKLHDGHTADMFLQKRIDARNSSADTPVRIAHFIPEEIGQQNHEWQRRQCGKRKKWMPLEQNRGHGEEQNEIVQHGHHAGSKKIVQRVHIGRRARYQPPHRGTVEKAHG